MIAPHVRNQEPAASLGNAPEWSLVHNIFLVIFTIALFIPTLSVETFYVDKSSQVYPADGTLEAPFQSIQETIDYIELKASMNEFPYDNKVSLEIFSEVYTESVILNPFYSHTEVYEWEFKAIDGEVNISGDGTRPFLFKADNLAGADIIFHGIVFKYLTIPNTVTGFLVELPCQIGIISFFNCKFSDLKYGINITEPYSGPAAVAIDELVVQNCNFNGLMDEGAGCYIQARNNDVFGQINTFVSQIKIQDNEFETSGVYNPSNDYLIYNIFISNGRLKASAYERIEINDNNFINDADEIEAVAISLDRINHHFYAQWPLDRTLKSYVYNNTFIDNRVEASTTKLNLTDNKAIVNNAHIESFVIFAYSPTYLDTLYVKGNYFALQGDNNTYQIDNATLVDEHNTYLGETYFINAITTNAFLNSSIISGYEHVFTLGDCEFEVAYCFLDEIETNGQVTYQQGIVTGDPLLDIDNQNMNYSLIWDTNQKSPCINSGYSGANNEITDPDGTPPDVGSVYYPHVHKVYPFFHTPQPPYIFWTSFPVVDDRTYVDNHHWNELGYLFSNHMINAPNSTLISIERSYDQEDGKMEWDDDNEEWEQTTHQVHPQIGYKITFANTPIDDVIVNGFKSDPETTSVAWSNDLAQGNWVGYFVPKTQCAFLSLSKLIPETAGKTYLDYVHKILTQTWATSRLEPDPRSPWIIGPERYTFSEGDMVVLALLPDAPNEMFWNITETTREPYTRDEVQFFSYQEKLDYTPMFIEFDPEDVPTEVGIYVNGECKGAAVVDYNLLEVNLYIEDAKAADIEIICHYEGKGKKKMANWTVYNPESGFFEIIPIAEVNTNDYIYISFAKEPGSSIMPMLTTLDQNYPNPFNPDTRISFTLAEPMAVCLEVFNLKGQKVKTLANGDFAKGRHAITWNARDERDQKVASGIYFYRLSTPQGKITAKMMLMK